MCLIQLAFDAQQKAFTVIANRDEFTARPAAAAHYWANGIFAGQDIEAGGTWLGLSKNRRFAAVTNVRHPKSRILGERSRGEIVTRFLTSTQSSQAFIRELQRDKELYGGFNVLLFDGTELHHYNNIFDETTQLASGYYTLSNDTLNTPWPKSVRVREQFVPLFEADAQADAFLAMMQDNTQAADEELPLTGIDPAMEKQLSSIFIAIDGYGTRCTTYIKSASTHTEFIEQTYENGVAVSLVRETMTHEK